VYDKEKLAPRLRIIGQIYKQLLRVVGKKARDKLGTDSTSAAGIWTHAANDSMIERIR